MFPVRLSYSDSSIFFLISAVDESDRGAMDHLADATGVDDDLFDDPFEPSVALNSFALDNQQQREAFLYEFCKAGEPILFQAVSHIWSSLEEPRGARCTAIGMMAGTGGKGKLALVHLLRACLKEVVTWGEPLPTNAVYSSLADWHAATMDAFESERAREDNVYKRYAAILNGGAG